MENSPITLAHNHARSALNETKRSNPVAASEEHDLAAAEFATAAQGTNNLEAQRILHLLEQHHKKLGHILKSHHERASQIPAIAEESPPSPVASRTAGAAATPLATGAAETNPAIPKLSQNFRTSHRELSNSIASNLASARGIPGPHQKRSSPASPALSAQHAPGRISQGSASTKTVERPGKHPSRIKAEREQQQPEPRRRRDTSSPSQQPQVSAEVGSALQPVDAQQNTTSDAPFQQFYSTFESLISKISAPLAFAGLPLSSTGPPAPKPPESAPPKPRREKSAPNNIDSPAGTDIDYSSMISRAALRAVRDGIPISVAESFYVVPTSGGTVSYAGILNREQKEASRHQRQLSNISEDTLNDDFVDARETMPGRADSPELIRLDGPPAPNPILSRARHSQRATGESTSSSKDDTKQSDISHSKTMEELTLENQALKHLSDTLSKRLHMWEVNAQTSSAALQQSLRSMHHRASSPAGSTAGRSDGDGGTRTSKAHLQTNEIDATQSSTADKQRIEELEERLKRVEKERGRQERENEKLKNVVGRYRERWEKLKEGARSRREGSQGQRNPTSSSPAPGGNNISGQTIAEVPEDGKEWSAEQEST